MEFLVKHLPLCLVWSTGSANLCPHDLAYSLFSFFFRILGCRPGMEPMPLALGVQSLNHWTTRKAPPFLLNVSKLSLFLQQIEAEEYTLARTSLENWNCWL